MLALALAVTRRDALSAVSLVDAALELRMDLYRFVAAAGRDHHLAEDIVQETLLRAQLERKPVRDPRAWCFTVALNLLRSHHRPAAGGWPLGDREHRDGTRPGRPVGAAAAGGAATAATCAGRQTR